MSRIIEAIGARRYPPQVPARRVVVSRPAEPDVVNRSGVLPENRIPVDRREMALNSHEVALQRELRAGPPTRGASARTRSRAFYRPQDQSPALPRYIIVERCSGQALARVRGDTNWVHNQVVEFARSQGVPLAELKTILEV